MFLFSQGLLKNNRIEKHIFCFAKRIFRLRRGRNTKRIETLAFATQNIDYQKHRRCLWEIYFVDLGQCGKYILFPQNVYFARAAGEIPNV